MKTHRVFELFAVAGMSLLSGCTASVTSVTDDSGDGAPEYLVLFADDFSRGFPNSAWIVAGSSTGFELDNSTGGFSAPSLKAVGSQRASAKAFANPFDGSTGLRILVGVRLSEIISSASDVSSPVSGIRRASIPSVSDIPLVEIIDESTGYAAAAVGVRVRSDSEAVEFYYRQAGVYSQTTDVTTEPATPNQFFAFSFTVNPDGSSYWSRNSVNVQMNTTTRFAGVLLRLRLRTVQEVNLDVHYDDVEVRKY